MMDDLTLNSALKIGVASESAGNVNAVGAEANGPGNPAVIWNSRESPMTNGRVRLVEGAGNAVPQADC
jgi:hypothetical protein